MANEEKMNIDIENQENFEKKEKIIIICLSAVLVFVTLIAGLFLVKKNKESGYENNDIGKVVNENNNNNNNDDDHENDDAIVNEGNYFFNKTSCQVITNILLFLFTGVLFFFWENDKLPKMGENEKLCGGCDRAFLMCGGDLNIYCGRKDDNQGMGIFEKVNWFGLASLGFLIAITFLVELILHLLLGSLVHLFSKDKNKRYFHTLIMFQKKRKQILFSLSETKTFFVVFSYLLGGFVIAIVARTAAKNFNPCCACWNASGEIVHEHGIRYFFGYCKDKECCESSSEEAID